MLYFGKTYFLVRKFGFDKLLTAMKKKKPIMFLESSSSYHLTVPENMLENVAFLKKTGDTVIIPNGTLKPCPQLGNAQVGHGDLYLSSLVPIDVNKFIRNEIGKGETTDSIADNLDKIVNEEDEIPEEYKTNEENSVNVYKTVSFDNIRNFLNTGLNRTLLKRMYQTLIEQKRLENLLGLTRDWMKIIIPIAILMVVGGIVLVMLQNSGFFDAMSGGVVGQAVQQGQQVNP